MTAPDRNTFKERADRRRERLLASAERAETESRSRHKRADQLADMIPLGQPILVGHHSEGRHRRHIAKIHSNMDKAVSLADEAKALRMRAAGVGDAGIRSEDPDAPRLLRERIDHLEAKANLCKRLNAELRERKAHYVQEHGATAAGQGHAQHLALIDQLNADFELPEDIVADLRSSARAFAWLPQFNLALTRANIKRLRDRLAQIERLHARAPAAPLVASGCTLTEDHDTVRLVLRFDARPSQEVCAACRHAGFHWSRTEGAWLRLLNPGARRRAELLLEEIARLTPKSSTEGGEA